MVMDFSRGWVKPGSVVTAEPLSKARLELARATMPQGMRRSCRSDYLLCV